MLVPVDNTILLAQYQKALDSLSPCILRKKKERISFFTLS